jgi:flagellar hook-length control protein FliK
VANDIVNPSVAVPVFSKPAAEITRAAPKTPPVTPAPTREETGGRSFAEELARSPDREAGRDSRQGKITRDSKDSAEKEKTLAADQPKKISQTVKNAAVATKDAIDAAPGVAFISGRLDAMDPSQIPTIVADTPFLSQAMAHEDIPQFMSQPTSILNLVRNLGLPVTLITEVQKLGIEPDQMMAPVDFLKAIGVDPQQVTAELSLLKGNVLAEGMLPYLNRAQALSAKNPKIMPTEPNKLGAFKNPLDTMKLDSSMSQTSNEWTPALLANQLGDLSKDRPIIDDTNLQAAALINAANLIAGQQVQNVQPMALVDLSQPRADSVPTLKIEGAHQETAVIANLVRQLTGDDQTEDFGVSLDELQLAAQSGNPKLSAPALSMDRFVQVIVEPRDGIVLDDEPLEMPSDWRPEDIANNAPGVLKKSTFDAFAVMGEQMKGMDTVRFDVAKLASDAADKSASESSILYGINSPQSVSAKSVGNLEASVAQISGADKLLSLDPFKDQSVNRTGSREKAPTSIEMKDQLQATIGAGAVQSRGDSGNRQNAGSNNDQSQGQAGQEKTAGDVQAARGQSQPARTQQSAATFAQRTEQPEVGLSPQQRYQIMQKVLNHATMMVKEGGGTVRLDLGTSELGSMQMAISMNKDQVDMRVITSSDRVREVMMAELSQLKNALSVQNVRLGNVEVGVSGRQPNGFAAFDGNPNQGRGRNFSDRDRSSEGRGIQGIKGLARRQFAGPIRMDTSGVSGLLNANGGKIAVRA